MPKSIFEQASADKSQLGFDYQDLICLEHLIDLKPGESVGLEVFDDVHHDRINGTKALIQVKHSVGDDSTLTNRDIDLWKTLSNWSKALSELDTDNIEFIFFTNKKKTNRNGIVQLLDNNQSKLSKITDTISEIKKDIDLKEIDKRVDAPENPIKKYVDYIYGLSNAEKESLFSKISLIISADDIFKRLTQKIEYFSVSNSESINVVYQLIGVFRKQKYERIKSGQKILIDYDIFRKEFQFDRIIKITQDRKIDFSRYHYFKNINNIDPKDGLFSIQLADIDISPEDITEYAIEYAATSIFIQSLIADGNFTEVENFSINEEVVQGWKSIYRQIYNSSGIGNEEKHKRVARDCLYKVEDLPIHVSNSTLSKAMVTGKGIELSDICRIGWRKNWCDLYGCGK